MSDQVCSRILLVEDDSLMREFIVDSLSHEGHVVVGTADVAAARAHAADTEFDVLLTDLRLPGEGGMSLVHHFRQRFPSTSVIVMTGYPDSDTISKSEELEISSYLVKPFTRSQLKFSVLGAVEKRRAAGHHAKTAATIDKNDNLGLVGVSSYYTELRRTIQQMARGEFPVLIQGPSGTGKEIVARAIHHCSSRSDKSLISINCGAIPRHLEESEFFGHAKGAFTGASAMKHGIIASADSSSLFLDEIGELSLETQAKLLRVLDTGEYMRIGETAPMRVSIRIISATNRDLATMVEAGTFRKDLYFRLRGGSITTKALAEHPEDIPALVSHFLAAQHRADVPRQITAEAAAALASLPWSGNIRELKHTIDLLGGASHGLKRINIATVRPVLKSDQPNDTSVLAYHEAKEMLISQFEAEYFTKLLQRFNGNVNQASKSAGMHRPNLLKKLKTLNILPDRFRSPKKGKVHVDKA